jgi:hypothetical protein
MELAVDGEQYRLISGEPRYRMPALSAFTARSFDQYDAVLTDHAPKYSRLAGVSAMVGYE